MFYDFRAEHWYHIRTTRPIQSVVPWLKYCMPQQNPTLTVRAFAEILRVPAYTYVRIVQEHKYPKQAPQSFRIPYYRPALSAIGRFYEQGNDLRVLNAARTQLAAVSNQARRTHNERVINAFASSNQLGRQFTKQRNQRIGATLSGVDLKLSPDFVVEEGGSTRRIYYNCRITPADPETARVMLEVADWVLGQSGISFNPPTLEFIDLANHQTTQGRPRRRTTLTQARQAAQVIAAVWAQI